MDAFRNAKAIGELSTKFSYLEEKVRKAFQLSNELEADHRKSVNFKLLLLIGLWILDKLVILGFFKIYNG